MKKQDWKCFSDRDNDNSETVQRHLILRKCIFKNKLDFNKNRFSKSGFSKIHHVDEKKSKSDEKNEEFLESEQVLNLTRKVTDLDLLYKESKHIL